MQQLKLNLIPGGIPEIIHISQYDSTLRTFELVLIYGEIGYDVSGDFVITVSGTKPDGKSFDYECQHDGNIVTVPVTEQMSAIAGDATCELTIFDKNGSRIASSNFILRVERAAMQSDAIISDSDIPVFEELIQEAVKSAASAKESQQGCETSAKEAGESAEAAKTSERASVNAQISSVAASLEATNARDSAKIYSENALTSEQRAAASESSAKALADQAKGDAESAKASQEAAAASALSAEASNQGAKVAAEAAKGSAEQAKVAAEESAGKVTEVIGDKKDGNYIRKVNKVAEDLAVLDSSMAAISSLVDQKQNKIIVQYQYPFGTDRDVPMDKTSTYTWETQANSSVNVPDGYKFLFGIFCVAWTNSNKPMNFTISPNVTIYESAKMRIYADSESGFNGFVPGMLCVFSKTDA